MPCRPSILPSWGPNGAPCPPGTADGIVPGPLAAGNAEATWLSAGAAEVQPWGIDNAPREAARPAAAVTAVPPMPDELKELAPEPTPGLSAVPTI